MQRYNVNSTFITRLFYYETVCLSEKGSFKEVIEKRCGICELSLANNFRKRSISMTNICSKLVLYFERSSISKASLLHFKSKFGMERELNIFVNGRIINYVVIKNTLLFYHKIIILYTLKRSVKNVKLG